MRRARQRGLFLRTRQQPQFDRLQQLLDLLLGQALLAVLHLQLDVQRRRRRIVDHHQRLVARQLERSDGQQEFRNVGAALGFGRTVLQVADGLRGASTDGISACNAQTDAVANSPRS